MPVVPFDVKWTKQYLVNACHCQTHAMVVTRINIFNLYTVGTVCCSCTNAAVLPEVPGASYASKCFSLLKKRRGKRGHPEAASPAALTIW